MKLAESSAPVVGPLGIAHEPPISIECDAFSGSLGLLLQSVKNHKVDLLGVPMLPICEAYFAYVLQTTEHDLDQAAAALAALAYLLERKAWMLIPIPEDEPSGDDLLEPFEYDPTIHEFGPAIAALWHAHEERESHYFRSAGDEALYEVPFDLSEVSSGDLARALERLLRRAVPEKPEILSKPRRSLADQMVIVAKTLPDAYKPLDEIVEGEFTRSEAVWWFLALLELIRLGRAKVALMDGEVMFASGDAP